MGIQTPGLRGESLASEGAGTTVENENRGRNGNSESVTKDRINWNNADYHLRSWILQSL